MREAGLTLSKLVGFAMYMAGAGCWAIIFHVLSGRF
jgi:hypothetical protein